MTSDSLINVSDRYIDLEAIKSDIKKLPRQNGYTYRPLALPEEEEMNTQTP